MIETSRLAATGKDGRDAVLLVDPAATDGAQLVGEMLLAQHTDTSTEGDVLQR